MALTDILYLILIGIFAGFVSGMMGVGGAIVIVPALVLVFGMSQHNAQGTSLAVLVFPVGALAVLNYYKKGYVNFKFAFVLILAFVLGSYLGSLVSVDLPEKTLKKIFAFFIIIIGARMLFSKN